MVVTAIFVILTGVVLANNSRFSNTIILQNLAHDIALSIRQAQVYGIAVRRCDPTVTTLCNSMDEFNVAYGMHFCPQGSGACVNPSAFELFVDVDKNASYDPGETVLSNSIAAGYRIDSICLTPASGGEQCVDELNVVFLRPEPDACINGSFNSDGDCISNWVRATVTVKSNRDDSAKVLIERTGQISVQ